MFRQLQQAAVHCQACGCFPARGYKTEDREKDGAAGSSVVQYIYCLNSKHSNLFFHLLNQM